MKKNLSGISMLLLSGLLAFGLTLGGCVALPVPAGEAIDATGIDKLKDIQFYAGATFELILMRDKNNQTDPTAKIRRGKPSYTREKIIIPLNTPCVVLRQERMDDGRLLLTVAFEKDETKVLQFIQDSTDLGYYTSFNLVYNGGSDIPVVQYGGEYYAVRSYVKVLTGNYFQTAEVSAHPFLGIKEGTVPIKTLRTATGRKL